MLINDAMTLLNKQTRGVAHFLLTTISGYSKYSRCKIQYTKKPSQHAMNSPCPSHKQQHYCTNIKTISGRTTLYVFPQTQHFNATIYMCLPRVLQSLYRDQTRGKHYHIQSSVLRGYEICMEGAGHKRLMNISHKKPKLWRPNFLRHPSIWPTFTSIDSSKHFSPLQCRHKLYLTCTYQLYRPVQRLHCI